MEGNSTTFLFHCIRFHCVWKQCLAGLGRAVECFYNTTLLDLTNRGGLEMYGTSLHNRLASLVQVELG